MHERGAPDQYESNNNEEQGKEHERWDLEGAQQIEYAKLGKKYKDADDN